MRLRADFREELDGDWGRFGGAQESIPPADEGVLVHAVWGVEFYTPAHAGALVDRLIKLGFDKRRSWAGRERVSDYVRRQRSGVGESWLNLGLVVPPDATGWMSDAVRIELPAGVQAGFLQLHSLTSSLTALVAMFVLEDESAGALDELIRRNDFRANGKVVGRGYTITPPSNVKDAAAKAQRRRTRSLVADWIAGTLPGTFAASNETTPTAELVTTELALPLHESSRDLEYLRVSGLSNWTPEVWQSPELQNWRLTFHDGGQVMTIAGRRGEVVASANLSDAGESERWSLTQRVNDCVAKDVLLWAAVRLVATVKDRLAQVRDEGRQLAVAHRPLNRLRRIARHLPDTLEGRTIAAELALYAQSKERFHDNAAEWEGVDELAGDLLENLRHGLRRLTRDLLATEERVRDGLIIESNMISTIANLRVQRWVVVLTVITVLVGVFALIVAMRHAR